MKMKMMITIYSIWQVQSVFCTEALLACFQVFSLRQQCDSQPWRLKRNNSTRVLLQSEECEDESDNFLCRKIKLKSTCCEDCDSCVLNISVYPKNSKTLTILLNIFVFFSCWIYNGTEINFGIPNTKVSNI